MNNRKSKWEITYHYMKDRFTLHGDRKPDIPVVHLALEIEEFRARGLAMLDTGFDAGIYPNIEIVKLF